MKRRFAAVLVATLAVAHGFAATSPKPKNAAATNKAARPTNAPAAEPPYDTRPVDPEAKALPPHYRGHGFRRIYDAAVVVAPKGEFETTAEYEARSKSGTNTALVAFVLQPPVSKYNADDGVLEVTVETATFNVGDNRERETGYKVEERQTSERQYVGSNAFGAKMLVTSKTYETAAILPKIGPLSSGVTFSLKTPRADAPRLKANVRVVAIGTVNQQQPPPIKAGARHNGSYYSEATIDDAFELSEKYFLLRMQLSDMWLFDARSGALLAKQSEGPFGSKMRLEIYQPKDNDGYAVVSVVGNDNLKLKRNFSKFGGGCLITIGNVNEITGMEGGVWGAGFNFQDLAGRRRVLVTSAAGGVLFDEAALTDHRTVWGKAQAAARAMWQASPEGFAEITNPDTRFPSKASLAGFRELWSWGVENCGFPSLEK